ncbi:uncharacterized protein LOC120641079 [Panicum virgatum]|uniref:DUF6598 domain-containing protein n=1 Tax=Panicum virgatum TaxID=38727 RepID=A0A8T0QMM0_PANVG|nr:uncharacterized protein LOC120641079 [Panicum virgatum]KAG2572306.1 hypothetical protein PVAP13_7KG169000 [Panicum virgatum]
MEIATESKSGSRDSDAEVAGCEKRMKETDYDWDGRLKLEIEWNPMKLQIQTVQADMDRLMTSGKGEDEGGIVQSEAKTLLEENGRIVQMLQGSLSPLLEKINQRFVDHEELDGKDASKMDSAMGSGHASKVDSAVGNSKEGHATKVDLAMRNSKEGLEGDKSGKRKVSKKEEKLQKQLEQYEEYRRKMAEEELHRDPEELTDPYACQARLFEKRWNELYLNHYGRLEDNTSIPCKRYTVNPAPCGGQKCDTLQVFSVKVAELTGGLQWPLDVFGMVALRDMLDHNRNIIFKRGRDNCQTLTDENPYLVLSGPVRGVVYTAPVIFEVRLSVRGITESDDKELSLLAARLVNLSYNPLESLLIKKSYTSRLSTLDFEHGNIVYSVEATISVKVISGPPDGFYGEFAAATDSLKCEILLHSSGFEERHLAGDEIKLSRSVVSVESFGKLIVSVRASDGSVTLTGTKKFRPLEKGITTGRLRIAKLCQLEFTVAWSLFSYSGT